MVRMNCGLVSSGMYCTEVSIMERSMVLRISSVQIIRGH